MTLEKELDKLESIDVDDPCDTLRYLVDEECKRFAKQGVNVYPFVPKRMSIQAVRGFIADCQGSLPVDSLTVAEAASRLGVCTKTVYTLVGRGQLDSVRVGPSHPDSGRRAQAL